MRNDGSGAYQHDGEDRQIATSPSPKSAPALIRQNLLIKNEQGLQELCLERLRSGCADAHIGCERKHSTSVMAPLFLAECGYRNELFSPNFFSDELSDCSIGLSCGQTTSNYCRKLYPVYIGNLRRRRPDGNNLGTRIAFRHWS